MKAQKQDPQPVATMKVVVPTHKIAPGQTETDAAFGIAYMDANGKLTPMSADESHQLTMTETLDTKKSSGKPGQICDKGCTTALSGTETVTDAMRVSGKNVVVLDKHFAVDGQPVKVIDPNTGKARDFVHQESSVKGGTNLSFGDNQ